MQGTWYVRMSPQISVFVYIGYLKKTKQRQNMTGSETALLKTHVYTSIETNIVWLVVQ